MDQRSAGLWDTDLWSWQLRPQKTAISLDLDGGGFIVSGQFDLLSGAFGLAGSCDGKGQGFGTIDTGLNPIANLYWTNAGRRARKDQIAGFHIKQS